MATRKLKNCSCFSLAFFCVSVSFCSQCFPSSGTALFAPNRIDQKCNFFRWRCQKRRRRNKNWMKQKQQNTVAANCQNFREIVMKNHLCALFRLEHKWLQLNRVGCRRWNYTFRLWFWIKLQTWRIKKRSNTHTHTQLETSREREDNMANIRSIRKPTAKQIAI